MHRIVTEIFVWLIVYKTVVKTTTTILKIKNNTEILTVAQVFTESTTEMYNNKTHLTN